eukprot:1198821-Amphidinium_carterae.1
MGKGMICGNCTHILKLFETSESKKAIACQVPNPTESTIALYQTIVSWACSGPASLQTKSGTLQILP